MATPDTTIAFSKMHGLGNDFVVIDAIGQTIRLTPEAVQQLADRHLGIGFDQLLLVERPRSTAADFFCRIFNADGTEAEQCGNGVRCFARFVHAKGLTDRTTLALETRSGLARAVIGDANLVSVEMGVPVFDPAALPFDATADAAPYPLEAADGEVDLRVVSMGNPHAVLMVDDVETAPVAELGAAIGSHRRFPRGVNVGFLEVLDEAHARLRVFERGSGETLACGSGACAAVAAGRAAGLLAERVCVELPGGRLLIEWPGDGEPVRMTGPAIHVFEGRITP